MTEPRDDWLDRAAVTPLPPRPGSFERIARSARRRRWVRAGATGVTVLALLAGLSGVVRELGQPGPGVGTLPGVSADPTVPPSVPTSPQPTGPPTQVGACTAAQITVDIVPGDNASGHIGLRVRFTNVSAQACTIRGYPRIAFVTGPAGPQINDPAKQAPGPLATVRLGPAVTAYANLLLANVADFPPATCQPRAVAGVRVTLPGDQTATYAAAAQQMCSRAGTGVAQVYPVSPAP